MGAFGLTEAVGLQVSIDLMERNTLGSQMANGAMRLKRSMGPMRSKEPIGPMRPDEMMRL